MGKIRKVLAFVIAMVMTVALGVIVHADDAGSITVTNAEIGKKYELYKLFDATVSPSGDIAYSLPEGKNADAFFNNYFEIKNGNIIQKKNFTTDVLKTDEFKKWASSFGSLAGETIASSGTVTWSPIDYGYYFVKSEVGAVLSVDSANPAANVIDKNQTVTFDKNIVEGDNLVKANQAGLKIDVPFDITVNAKNYDGEEKIFEYVIYDTMDPGWTMKDAPVVKVGETTLDNSKYAISYKDKDDNATTTLADAEYFEISIPWTTNGTKDGDFLYQPNDKINVTYTAILDPEKAAFVNVGTTANLNTAQVKYYKGGDQPNQPSGDLGTKQTKTWETGLTIIKKDGEGNVLTGAQFTLTSTNGTKVSYVYEKKYVADAAGTYYKLKDGTYTAEAPNNDETHDSVYENTSEKYKLVEEAKVMGKDQNPATISSYVDDEGKVKFTGLGAGTYKIEETVVPAGYNKADDIEFTIGYEINYETLDITWNSNNDKVVPDGTTKLFDTTVVNNKGTELPSTGGMGTTIFYVIGGILVLAAAIILISKRRVQQ